MTYREIRLAAPLIACVLAFQVAGAQTPGIDDAITDGVPFELDDPTTLAALQAVHDDISGQAVHDCVAELTKDIPHQYRVMGTPTQDAFLQEYAGVFEELGLDSALQEFSEGGPGQGLDTALGEGGTNIVAVLPGQDLQRWIVMGGHYDTRELTLGGGALDNASGICTVLELARAFKAYTDDHGPLEASVVFNWYDGEEWGLYGAIAFAEDLSVPKALLGLGDGDDVDILVSQSYDMPGLNYPARNIWVEYGDPAVVDEYAVLNLRTAPIHADEEWACWSYGCYEELKQRDDFEQILRRNANYQFLVREVAYDLMGLPPELVWVYDDHYGRSDHIPLIAKGAAGMRIQGSHDEEFPCYHQPCDTLEWLYVQAGSQEELIAAYDTEARAGGVPAFYTALTGDVGHYGDVLWFGDDPAAYRPGGGSQDTPVPAPLLLVALLAGLAWIRVRRKR